MSQTEKIKEFLDEINARSNSKEYKNMSIEQLSSELRNAMKFEAELNKKIEELENHDIEDELIKYAKILSSNSIQREIHAIEDVYLEKLDTSYLNSKN